MVNFHFTVFEVPVLKILGNPDQDSTDQYETDQRQSFNGDKLIKYPSQL